MGVKLLSDDNSLMQEAGGRHRVGANKIKLRMGLKTIWWMHIV